MLKKWINHVKREIKHEEKSNIITKQTAIAKNAIQVEGDLYAIQIDGNISNTKYKNNKKFTLFTAPMPCENFISRNDFAEKIHKEVSQYKNLLLYSVGGLGKTEFIRYYVKEYKEFYDNIGYIVWPDEKTEFSDFATELIRSTDIDTYKITDFNKQYDAALMHLSMYRNEKSLLIIDNVPENIIDESLNSTWRKIGEDLLSLGIFIIICSREKYSLFHTIEYIPMNNDDCKLLFEIYWGKLIDSKHLGEWNNVLKLSNKHTLILEIMARTLNIMQKDIFWLNNKLLTEGFDLSNVKIIAPSFKKSIYGTIRNHICMLFNIQKVCTNEEKALLKVLCLYPMIKINITELMNWLNDDNLINTSSILIKKGWLRNIDLDIWIHPLVADAAIRLFSPKWNDLKKLAIGIYNYMIIDFQNGESIKTRRYLLPLVDVLIKKFKSISDFDYAKICSLIGKYYFRMRNIHKALAIHKLALNIYLKEDVKSKCVVELADLYNDIAKDYRRTGKPSDIEKAKNYHKKALTIHLKNNNLRGISVNYNNLGLTYCCEDKGIVISYENSLKALFLFKKALEINKKLYKTKHVSLGYNYNNIGMAYYYLKEYERSLKFYNCALNIRRELLDEDDPEIARVYINKGHVYFKLKLYNDAECNYLYAKKIQECFFGNKHLDTMMTNYHIAKVNFYKGNYIKAFSYLYDVVNLNDEYLNLYSNEFFHFLYEYLVIILKSYIHKIL